MSEISFETTRVEFREISEIADRSLGLSKARINDPWTKQDIMMDLSAVHANGNPLRLEELRQADDFNFAHDILGIRRHLNRETGKLEDGFRPRFSRRKDA